MTGTGYSGHYFWDTEIFVLPFLTYTSPQMARSELRFRYNMLGAARRRAEELAQSGALFRGARSTVRRHRPITQPGPRNITSTLTLPTRSASTSLPAATRNS